MLCCARTNSRARARKRHHPTQSRATHRPSHHLRGSPSAECCEPITDIFVRPRIAASARLHACSDGKTRGREPRAERHEQMLSWCGLGRVRHTPRSSARRSGPRAVICNDQILVARAERARRVDSDEASALQTDSGCARSSRRTSSWPCDCRPVSPCAPLGTGRAVGSRAAPASASSDRPRERSAPWSFRFPMRTSPRAGWVLGFALHPQLCARGEPTPLRRV